ncbi:hypothetical protein N0V90_003565 [Kalmusia sp. IMI 367209]|nr:hypothetical protein N0V90_003565 [Kalmusia sp. IMI 367209]
MNPIRLLERKSDGEIVFRELFTAEVSAYAILSHTWGKGEVTFEDMKADADISKTISKAGWRKIQFCAEQAVADGLRYFWVDTCCIDKKNPIELSTAINSMFRWYQNAACCYVYLSDVSTPDEANDEMAWQAAFRKSQWFTRGWTLQELIAPRLVNFFSFEGKRLGSRSSLESMIHDITCIPVSALRGQRPLTEFSVEERMSWAAKRTTTFKEDKIYCLLGIFGVSLPPIYGEGEAHATLRLEEEIQKNQVERHFDRVRGLFAPARQPSQKRLHTAHQEQVPQSLDLGAGIRLLERLPGGDFQLVAFDDDNPPPYAILSHTWEEGQEVTYNELVAGTGNDKNGYAKLQFCSRNAVADSLRYFWVDSCCINKSNSQELSTAINSMFRWYQRASVCYVYLSDVSIHDKKGVFRHSRWFTRGWTLQELLAPATIKFFSKECMLLGTKGSLEQEIFKITQIPIKVLRGQSFHKISVEERTSWAAKRTTTLKEDKVYCLLGILGISLPLIYGEGEAYATLRLKDEIQKQQQANHRLSRVRGLFSTFYTLPGQ